METDREKEMVFLKSVRKTSDDTKEALHLDGMIRKGGIGRIKADMILITQERNIFIKGKSIFSFLVNSKTN
jgi:hypothetical protein